MEIISRETLEQNGRIIHDTEVDIGNKRPVVTPIHIVQYDNTLPVIAVKIYKDGNPHKLSSYYSARIRWKTADGIRYEEVMGRSDPSTETLYTTIYFTVDVDMTRCFGELNPIIEVSTSNMLSGSSPIPFVIHRNPIQESEIENDIERKGVVLAPVATSGSYDDLGDKIQVRNAGGTPISEFKIVKISEEQYAALDPSEIDAGTLYCMPEPILLSAKSIKKK